MKKSLNLSILIPVYNEERTVKKILKCVTTIGIESYEVIIVNDASTDSSSLIIKEFLKNFKSNNVELSFYEHKQNLGKGAGIKTGIKHAHGDYFVIQDADLEYNPMDLVKVLDSAIDNKYDVVYGSRFLGNIRNMPKANYVANRFYNKLLYVIYGVHLTDMHTCYKMVRTKLIKELNITSNGFDYATELISKLLKRKIEIKEVPIRFKGRTKKEGKKINFMDGLECTYKLIKFRFSDSEKLFNEKNTTNVRFVFVGGIGFITNYAILVFLFQVFKLDHISSELIAAFIALHVTFLLHDKWTYTIHTPKGTERLNFKLRYISYLLSNSFGSLITVVVFGILYEYTYRLPALLIAATTGVIWNYILNTYFIWKKK